MGLLRRTLELPAAGSLQSAEALAIAFSAALLWSVHPLATAAVGYVVQRAESLMGLLYLLSLYAFNRVCTGKGFWPWGSVCLVSCFLGVATKEVMATAPLIMLLYDRIFFSDSFSAALSRRRWLYAGLGSSWILLGWLVSGTAGRGRTAGFGSGVSVWDYATTQLYAGFVYAKLCVWPHPIVGDYGRILGGGILQRGAGALIGVSGLVVTLRLFRSRPPLAFLGAWILVILAPSSSVIPVATEVIAAHRMYLPLCAVAVAGVLLLRAVAGSLGWVIAYSMTLAVALGVVSSRRAAVYNDPFTFWSDVAANAPWNAGAWNNLGVIKSGEGKLAAAVLDYVRAIAIAPDYATAHFNLGRAYLDMGRVGEAEPEFEAALRFLPNDAAIHFDYAKALALERRPFAAAAEFRRVVRLDPTRADAWFDLGSVMVQVGNVPEAVAAYAKSVNLNPNYAEAHIEYANLLAQTKDFARAEDEYKAALRLAPRSADARNNLGILFAQSGRLSDAKREFEEALKIRPNFPGVRENLRRVEALEQGGLHP
jgi:tetratricopeptide (TPR) repeat protein